MQKVVVFLDFANISKAAKNLSIRINQEHLLKNYLTLNEEGRFLQAAYAYVPIDPRREHATDAVIERLWSAGYVVKSKLGVISGPTYKCNFDVEITMDVMRAVYDVKPDIVTIISGDSDYVPLVIELRKMGIYVETASFGASMSRQLSQRASGYICLDNYYADFYSSEPSLEPAVTTCASLPPQVMDATLTPETDISFDNPIISGSSPTEYVEGDTGEPQINLPEAE